MYARIEIKNKLGKGYKFYSLVICTMILFRLQGIGSNWKKKVMAPHTESLSLAGEMFMQIL